MRFDDFICAARNVYSQTGEDGILEWLFNKIEPKYRMCVEFGAWDGRHLSNTFNLVAHLGWKGIYIEADLGKFQVLEKTAAEYPQIIPVLSLVESSGPNALDNILQQRQVPENFGLLSIDVDGNDYEIWEGMTRFQPDVVIIEHNPSMPPGFEYVDRGGLAFTGSSATSLHLLAQRKGYELLGCTFNNSFFLRQELFAVLKVKPQSVEQAFDRREVCQVFTNFAGEFVFSNPVVKSKLRRIVYSGRGKTLSRRLAGMPTCYVLDEPHARENAIMRFLRWIVKIS